MSIESTATTALDHVLAVEDRAHTGAPRAPGPGYLDASEKSLIERIRRGDDRAFAILVRTYQDRVFALCVRMLGRREEAEDLTQEIFVAVHRGLGGFRAEARLSTWIYQVTRNRCLNRIKYLDRRREDGAAPLDSVSDRRLAELSGRAPVRPDHHFEGRELQGVLEAGLLALPEAQRLMVILRDVDGLAYEEIAEICDLAPGTVKSRLHRARTALAERVARYRAGVNDEPASGEGPDGSTT